MVSVLLALQVMAFGLELCVFLPEIQVKHWYTQFRQWTMPTGVAVASAILSPLAFAGLGGVPGTSSDQQCTGGGVDGDVAGDGVRIGIWVQISVLVVISLLGIFHHGATGAKEVGAGLVLTHVSVTIAVAAQVAGGGVLSLADAATGAMILDAQNAALSIQLTAKETLAARWQVSLVVATQALGLAVIPVLVTRLADGSLIGGACPCVEVFWWAWLGNCSTARDRGRERAVFWIYYACRCVGFVQSAFHATYNTSRFHHAEPKCSGPGLSEEQKLGRYLEDITYPYLVDTRPVRYAGYPATVSLMYGLYGVLAITSLAAAELTIRDLSLQPTSAIDSIGQIIALVIAIATIIRVVWLFWKLFTDERKEGKRFWGFIWPGYTWPFDFHNSNFGYSFGRLRMLATYLLPVAVGQPMILREENLPLGSILKDPYWPGSRFDDVLPLPEYRVETILSENRANTVPPEERVNTVPPQERTEQYLLPSRFGNRKLTAVDVETRSFSPADEEVRAVVAKPEVAEYIKSQQTLWSRPKVYLVSGIKLARGLQWDRDSTQSIFKASGDVSGLPATSEAAGADITQATALPAGQNDTDLLLLAYRLTEIKTADVPEYKTFQKGALLI